MRNVAYFNYKAEAFEFEDKVKTIHEKYVECFEGLDRRRVYVENSKNIEKIWKSILVFNFFIRNKINTLERNSGVTQGETLRVKLWSILPLPTNGIGMSSCLKLL